MSIEWGLFSKKIVTQIQLILVPYVYYDCGLSNRIGGFCVKKKNRDIKEDEIHDKTPFRISH
ncbi:hypothetical protein ACUIJN_19730 [Metabacillus halosaccharovorans]|uniref:hypothetical protein n=1 Tax=Metabacillus halosaccharovorans TaxID=930124 RepID=UPI00403DBDC7